MVRDQGQPYIFEDLMAMNDTSMQEYGLFQVSNAGHRADLQLGSHSSHWRLSRSQIPPSQRSLALATITM